MLSPGRTTSSRLCRSSFLAHAVIVTVTGADPHIPDDENVTDSPERSTPRRAVAEKMTFSQILVRAGKKGLGGGIPGAIAGVVQVLTLMGLRTVINYQMRYGTTFFKAFDVLYKVSFGIL